ncbi:MAG: ATP-binding protein [Prevotella sp.]|nr:ATP-binding protein [Prevotella sp.]
MAILLQFTVGNYRSFHQERTFTMIPNSIQDEPKESVVVEGHYKYLTVSAIYGANSSGKSNFVDALSTMKNMVLSSVRLNDHDPLLYDPFLLADEQNQPTHFEIVYLDTEDTQVRYGFDYTLNKIEREWLFFKKKNKEEQPYFVRDEEGIGVDEENFSEGAGFEEKANDNRLFISLVAQLGGAVSKKVLDYFKSGYIVISGLDSQGYEGLTERQFLNGDKESEDALRFFKDLQLGFEKIKTRERETEKGEKTIDVFTTHNVYNNTGETVGKRNWRMDYFESQGTQKLFELAGPLFDVLRHGRLLVMDELDARMHPLISQYIIKLFNSRRTNPRLAQLLFTTHDTNLLSSHLLRRDQIWFTEKDKTEATDLYSLMHIVLPDGSKPRGDGNLERNYIKGRYGAIPYLKTIE